MSKLEEITEQALALEPLERSHLIDSLITKAWIDEAQSRLDAYERGELEAFSLEEVKRELDSE